MWCFQPKYKLIVFPVINNMFQYKSCIRFISLKYIIRLSDYFLCIWKLALIITRVTLLYMFYLTFSYNDLVSLDIFCHTFIYFNINFSDTIHFVYRHFAFLLSIISLSADLSMYCYHRYRSGRFAVPFLIPHSSFLIPHYSLLTFYTCT